jgi:hypothetical protein
MASELQGSDVVGCVDEKESLLKRDACRSMQLNTEQLIAALKESQKCTGFLPHLQIERIETHAPNGAVGEAIYAKYCHKGYNLFCVIHYENGDEIILGCDRNERWEVIARPA